MYELKTGLVGGEAIVPLGHLDETRHIHDVHIARVARQAAIDAGLFVYARNAPHAYVTGS